MNDVVSVEQTIVFDYKIMFVNGTREGVEQYSLGSRHVDDDYTRL